MEKLLSNRELQKLSTEEKIKYFNELRETCLDYKKKNNIGTTLARNFVRVIYPPIVRRYDYEVIGKKYVPENGKAIFLCNHSNSHDFFTPLEVMHKEFGLEPTVLVASDDLDKATQKLFASCNAVLVDRNDKESREFGIFEFCSKMIGENSVPGWIYGESTWNIHPYKLMQGIKTGIATSGAITEYPIIPTIIEYVEVDEIVNSESKLYRKCIVKFNPPVDIIRFEDLISQSNHLQSIMERSRAELKSNLGTLKLSMKDVIPSTYINHTWLKKFDGFGFTYDSESEAKFLLSKDGVPADNEYRLNERGILVPGVTSKEEGKRYFMKIK